MLLLSSATRHLFILMAISIGLLTNQSVCVTRRYSPLARNQRQTITNELASGFSGTGTSFSSVYGDPYFTQQQQQQQTLYDDSDYQNSIHPSSKQSNVPTLPTNRNWGSYGGGAQGGWRGFGATKGGGRGGYKGAGRPSIYGSVKY